MMTINKLKIYASNPRKFIFKIFDNMLLPPILNKNLLLSKRLLKINDRINYSKYSNGVLKAKTSDRFYKMQILQNTLYKDIDNRNIFQSLDKYLVPIEIYTNDPVRIKMELLDIIESEEEIFLAAKTILKDMAQFSWTSGTKDMKNLIHIMHGLEIINGLFGKQVSDTINKRIMSVLNRGFRIGVLHGDFHSGNIMKNAESLYKMIDFDRSEACSAQAIDVLHFILWKELYKCNYSVTWYEELLNICKNEVKLDDYYELMELYLDIPITDGFLLLFLDRISKDEEVLIDMKQHYFYFKTVVEYFISESYC